MSIRPRRPSTHYDLAISSRINAFLNANRDYPVPNGQLLTMYVDPEQQDTRPGAVELAILSKEQRDWLTRATLDGSYGLYIVVRKGAEVLHERLARFRRKTQPDIDPEGLVVHINERTPSHIDQSSIAQDEIGNRTAEETFRFYPKPKVFDFETIASKEHFDDGRQTSNNLPRPCRWLSLANRIYPKLSRFVDDCRSKPNRTCPKSVFVERVEIARFLEPNIMSYLRSSQREEVSETELDLILQEVGVLCALSSWRPTQGIYRFDSEIYEELINTPFKGDLPFELLYLLPEWCVYVETPHLEHYYGFFACLDYHSYVGKSEIGLFLVFDRSDGLYADVLPFSKAPLPEIVEKLHTRDGVVHGDGLAEKQEAYQRTISLLLYLCASNSEIGMPPRRPTLPTPKKTKDGWRLFPPEKPTTWDVGVRIGAALRRAKAQAAQTPDEALAVGRSSKRPHIRRAHWHAFWHGPRAEPETRVLKLHWLHPMAVKVESIEDLPAVVRPVKP